MQMIPGSFPLHSLSYEGSKWQSWEAVWGPAGPSNQEPAYPRGLIKGHTENER